jgi:hypothetical protein
MTEKREWRRSEARRLKPRPCGGCKGTEYPWWQVVGDELDPAVVIGWNCPNPICDNHTPQ